MAFTPPPGEGRIWKGKRLPLKEKLPPEEFERYLDALYRHAEDQAILRVHRRQDLDGRI